MAKALVHLNWIENLLPENFARKHMFGGFGYYVEGRIVLAVFESEGDRTYKNQSFNFDLWNGCLFPTEREHHRIIKQGFPQLIPHPILSKWLYLPLQTENFDSNVEEILQEIRRRSKLFGVMPKLKKSKKVKISTLKNEKVNALKPQMFSDEPARERIQKAQKISDLKNLGPASEMEFCKAGIKTVNQFIKLGWKKAMIKLVAANPKNRHSVFAYALIGALSNVYWARIPESKKTEAKKFTASLKTIDQ